MRRKSAVSTGIGFLHSCWNKEQSILLQQLPTVLGCLPGRGTRIPALLGYHTQLTQSLGLLVNLRAQGNSQPHSSDPHTTLPGQSCAL